MIDLYESPSPTTDSTIYGIGGYNTISNLDQIFAFDYLSVGKIDHVVVYRPGSGILWIVENQSPPSQAAIYQPVYQEGDPANGVNGTGFCNYDLMSTADRIIAFDLEGSGKMDDLVMYRPGAGICWILQNNANNKPGTFSVAYSSPVVDGQAQGISGYNLTSPDDRMFAFDLEGSGKMDDLVLYRPGAGICFVLQNNADNPGDFSVAFSSSVANGQPQGIGGYDLTSTLDRAFAFDYDGSGFADDIALYRPGSGTFWVLLNNHTTPASFGLPYPPPPPVGVAGYDLLSTADQVFAFDYEGNGNLDDLVCFRAGQGTVWVLQNTHAAPPDPPTFTVALQETGNPPYSTGIGGFDCLATVDQGFAFDFSGKGLLDYLLFYRPGTGAISILKNNRTTPDSFDPAPYQVGLTSMAQVQSNLNNMIALNTNLYLYGETETEAAYHLLTGDSNNSTNWPLSIGLDVLAGAFAAAAAAVGTITGVGALAVGLAAMTATVVPGMIDTWLEGGSTPNGGNVNDTVAGLVLSFQNARDSVNSQLGVYANDVGGNWNQQFTFDNQTTTISALASVTFPTEGPVYNALYQQMTASYLLQIWQTILRANYVITEFESVYLVSQPDPSYYATYYQENPAYLVNFVSPECGFYNIGTGVSHWFGGNGDMAKEAANFLFSNFDRGAVFWLWGIPVAPMATWPAPGPMPPGSE